MIRDIPGRAQLCGWVVPACRRQDSPHAFAKKGQGRQKPRVDGSGCASSAAGGWEALLRGPGWSLGTATKTPADNGIYPKGMTAFPYPVECIIP